MHLRRKTKIQRQNRHQCHQRDWTLSKATRIALLFTLALVYATAHLTFMSSANSVHNSMHQDPAAALMEKANKTPVAIVVGGGLAGLSSTIEAVNSGAQVILIEKESKLGGNSAKATSGINACDSFIQKEQGIQDALKYFERDTFKSGVGGDSKAELVKMLTTKSADAIRFLTGLGVPLSKLSQLGGHSRKRTHRAPDKPDGTPVPIGFTIMQTLERHIRANLSERVTVMEDTSVVQLLHETKVRHDGFNSVRVKGVEIEHKDGDRSKIFADAVILATGGFSNDKTEDSLLKKYAPNLSSFPTTNGPWATGDGVKLAEKLGATLVDMDKVQLHPTGLINPKDPANPTKFLGPEALRGSGGILLNKKGERFVNELELRSVVSNAIIAQGNEFPGSNGSTFAYCVLNEAAAQIFGMGMLGFYWRRVGLFEKADTMEDLAKLIGCSVETVRQTLEDYEKMSKEQRPCPQTGKNVYPCVLGPQGPFYVAFVTPSIHYTMGGCLISPSAEILQEQPSTSLLEGQRPIYGLFGAGEVTGGVHGRNRLGGNSLLECVVFGRIAGRSAAQVVYNNVSFLHRDSWSQVNLQSVMEDSSGFIWLRFHLPSALQISGLQTLQSVAIRNILANRQIELHIPFTSVEEEGIVGIVIPAPHSCSDNVSWIRLLQPGDEVEMKAADPLNEQEVALIKAPRQVIVATPRGVGPMMQLLHHAFGKSMTDVERATHVHVIFIANSVSDIQQREYMQMLEKQSLGRLRCTFVLQNPPTPWTGGVDYADEIVGSVYPDASQSIFLCGSGEEMKPVQALLREMGHRNESIVTLF